ncbi:hypothetical protein ACFL43_00385 [Thermodesulfobacteriota bacterium]
MRNPNPFTPRQLRLLEAFRNRLVAITDPDPDIITHESYSWASKLTKTFGSIPTIIFKPQGSSNRIKAEIIRAANLTDPGKDLELKKIRKQYGITERKHKEARLFNAEIDQLMFNIKKHIYASAFLNRLFVTKYQKLSDPITLMQNIIMTEFKADLGKKTDPIHNDSPEQQKEENETESSYSQELMEAD